MKNKQYQEMYKEYLKGYSLAEVGKMYGMTRQSVYSGFKLRGYDLRIKKLLPFQTFNNIRFTLMNNGYYRRTDKDRQLMHSYVWEYYYDKILIGYDLHHINHDKTDNRIKNLELYTKSEHAKKFNTGSNQHVKKTLQKTY